MSEQVRVGASTNVVFRSAKGRSFAERKTTIATVISEPTLMFLQLNAVGRQPTVCSEPRQPGGVDRTESGQLAGAYWGGSNIPPSLRSGLARIDLLEHALAGILGE